MRLFIESNSPSFFRIKNKLWATRPILVVVLCTILLIGCSQNNLPDDSGRYRNKDNRLYGVIYKGIDSENNFGEYYIYLIKYNDDTSSKYKIVDSIKSNHTYKTFEGKLVTYFANDGIDVYFIAGNLGESYSVDTLITFYNKSDVADLLGLYQYDYNMKKSFLACVDRIPDNNDSTYGTLLVNLENKDNIDTIYAINDGFAPIFSADDGQLYVHDSYYDSNDSRCNIGILDLPTMKYSIPLDSCGYNNYHAFRLDINSSLYFIRSNIKTHDRNLWRYNIDFGEEQVTFVDHPQMVMSYKLNNDSIICSIGEVGKSQEDETELIIKNPDSNSK